MKRILILLSLLGSFFLSRGSIDADLEGRLLDEKRIEAEIQAIEKRKAFMPADVKELEVASQKQKKTKEKNNQLPAKQKDSSFSKQGQQPSKSLVSINEKQPAAFKPSELSEDQVSADLPRLKESRHPETRQPGMKPSTPSIKEPASVPQQKLSPATSPQAPSQMSPATKEKPSPPSPNILAPKAPKPEDFSHKTVPKDEDKRQIPKSTLKALIFFKDLQKMVPNPSIYPDGITLVDMHIAKEEAFESTMKRFLGRRITTDLLLQIKEAVVRHYWNIGGPLVRVFVPADQDISQGKIQFYIRHSVLGLLQVNAGKYTPKEAIEKQISVKPGDEIFTGDLLDDKDWLENDPFRSVDIVYEPGELLGTTDIIIGVEERKPLHMYAGMEISSYKTASSKRWKVGFTKGHLFRQPNHQLNAEVMVSPYVKKWNSLTGNYILSLPHKQMAKVFFSVVRTKPLWWEISMPEYLTARGLSYSIGGRYHFKLPHRGFYFQLLQFGYDFKRSNSYIDYFGTIFGRSIDVSQFLIRYEGAVKSSRGSTNFGISWYLSPGNMTAFNHSKQFRNNQPDASCRYMYAIFNMDHFVNLPVKMTWITNIILQATGSKLVGLEQMSLGGRLTVRGYAEGEAIGDFGLLVKNEARTVPMRFIKSFKDSLQLLAFVDFGYVNDVNQNVLSRKSAILLSAGPGLRYIASKYANIRFDLGWQIKPVHGRLFGRPMKKHGHMGAYFTY